jgi:hypothetical protein
LLFHILFATAVPETQLAFNSISYKHLNSMPEANKAILSYQPIGAFGLWDFLT